MKYQAGGTATVRTYLLVLLIAAGVASAATNIWLANHRQIVLEFSYRP